MNEVRLQWIARGALFKKTCQRPERNRSHYRDIITHAPGYLPQAPPNHIRVMRILITITSRTPTLNQDFYLIIEWGKILSTSAVIQLMRNLSGKAGRIS